MIGALSVILRHDQLRERRNAADGLIREVERRLLLAHEGRVEAVRSSMSRVGRDDSKPAKERRGAARGLRAERKRDTPVQPAAALLQEAAVPVVGQIDSELDAVRLAVAARASIDNAVDAAVRRQLQLRCGTSGAWS